MRVRRRRGEKEEKRREEREEKTREQKRGEKEEEEGMGAKHGCISMHLSFLQRAKGEKNIRRGDSRVRINIKRGEGWRKKPDCKN